MPSPKNQPPPSGPSAEALQEFVRTEAARYLLVPNINSVGIGRKQSSDKTKEGQLCLQFTVDRKMAPEGLESVRSRLIPPLFLVDGYLVPTDVLERRYAHAFQIVPEEAAVKEPRKRRQEVLRPGLSVANISGTAGTIGAIVYDRETGSPLLLSNWHVLQTTEGQIGDTVVQPGPFDDNDTGNNFAGHLLRSHLGAAGDCAVATIEGRAINPEVLGISTVLQRLGKAELDDRVVKSGRTTGVTRGKVVRVEVQTKMTYGDREVVIGGFEIGFDPRRKPSDGELTKPGDSGAPWVALDPKTGKLTDVLLGLHFAGETDEESPEFALACNAHSVFEKLNISFRPPQASSALITGVGAEAARTFGGKGYDESFLGTPLRLPVPTSALAKDLIGANGQRYAHYTHFSLTQRKSRRLCALAAWNIDGARLTKVSKEASWALDSRIPDTAQIGDVLYARTKFDKGHIAKREDLVWGPPAEAKRANDDSFCYSNATPQHEKFNRLAPALWKSLEDELMSQLAPQRLRLSVFGGPLFRPDDLEFVASGAPAGTPKIRIPREYFKIVAYRDSADGGFKAHAFILSQAKLIQGKLESIAAEALDLERFQMYQVKVSEIEKRTGFKLTDLARIDTKVVRPGGEALGAETQVLAAPTLVEALSDIL
ncbi:MAG: DNA/RNA non-specific endonuclease [Verrucomicrobiales bacterium]|nr:DNA/RNA non-specific endonuclease [Verrucomicrobiales bacterium]